MPAAEGRRTRETGDDHPNKRGHDAGKKHPGHPRDRTQIAIKQRGNQQTGGGGGEVGIVEGGQRGPGSGIKSWEENGKKARQPDAARCDGQRRGKAQLPDVEKAEPVARPLGTIDFSQEGVGTARAWKGRAQFGPDQTVGNGNHGAQHPGPNGKSRAGGGDHQRKRDEGADADHLKHVEEDGGTEADAALELGWDRRSEVHRLPSSLRRGAGH